MKQNSTFSAAKATAALFGVLAGLGGLTHGIGEVLQGSVKPDGIIIESWKQGPIATNLGGEPGMTIVPNMLISGILTILVSLAVVVSAVFIKSRKGGWRAIFLSVIMLLVGGGFAPPVIGIPAGVAGTGIGAESPSWRSGRMAGARRFFGLLWPWVFGISAILGLFLVVGSVVLVYFFGLNKPDLFSSGFLFLVPSLILTIVAGRAFDARQRDPALAALT